jgi:chromosomal replication initiation ATPase DnaA
LGELQLQMTKPTFDTWLKPSQVIGYEDDTFIVSVETPSIKDWLERKLLSSIKRSLSGILGRPVEVKFVVAEDIEQGRGLNAVTPTIGRKAVEHWRDALDELRLDMAKPTFETWIEPCKPLAYEDGEFVIAVPSEAHRDWLERRLLSPIKRALSGILSRPVEVSFVVVGS